MRKIYKYPIPVCEKYVIDLPLNAKIIRVSDVDGFFYLWAVVDANILSLEKRHLELYKTGQDIQGEDNLVYLGFCKIYIGMELGLYVFENLTLRGEECTVIHQL